MGKNWIQHPTILKGTTVDLIPLQKEHFDELYMAASDKDLWKLVPIDCSDRQKFDTAYNFALEEREKGRQYPFTIYHKATKRIIGSTRFFEIHPKDKKLEIGWTWIIKEFQGTDVNFECKLMLMTFCFEILKTNRVQLKTKDTNYRSRKAIEKIGGVFEGIQRKDRVQDDGTTRNAAYYSIIDDEWPAAKNKILQQLAERRKGID
jgi:RimJ/RimL family protein N-acetyltransferase